MSNNCQFCGEPLSFTQRMTRKYMHPKCRDEQDAIAKEYRDALNEASTKLTFNTNVKSVLEGILKRGKFNTAQLHTMNLDSYQNIKEKFLEGANLTDEKREFLRLLQSDFQLTDEEAESNELDHIRHLVWISEGNLPQITTSIRLKKGEVAHFEGEVTWSHLKTRKKRVAGTRSQRVKIAKGVSFKVGGTPGYSEEYQEFQEVDRGKVLITNDRLLFFGGKKNLNINFDKIMEIESFSDAVKIQRGTVNPTYLFMDSPTQFSVILQTAMEFEA